MKSGRQTAGASKVLALRFIGNLRVTFPFNKREVFKVIGKFG
jgi:hypothetical protein